MLEKLFSRRHIQNLNLDSVRAKLTEKQGWSEIQAMRAEQDYKRFLYALAHKQKDDILSPPTQEVDEFWHQHILDTRKYREDCDTIFGHYIDHTPGLSPANQSRADARRRQIYKNYRIDEISFSPTDSSTSSGDGIADGDGLFSSHSSHSGNDAHSCHDGSSAHGDTGGGHAGDSGSCDTGDGGGSDGGGGDGGGCGGGCGGG